MDNNNKLVRLFIIIAVLFSLFGCGVTRQIPVETKVVYEYRDSTIIKDSIRPVFLPVERISDIRPIPDTLELETSLAEAKMWLNGELNVLQGEIHNKPQAQISTPYKERVIYRDSVVTQEVPVEVEVIQTVHPKYELYLWIWTILTLLGIGIFIYLKISGKSLFN